MLQISCNEITNYLVTMLPVLGKYIYEKSTAIILNKKIAAHNKRKAKMISDFENKIVVLQLQSYKL